MSPPDSASETREQDAVATGAIGIAAKFADAVAVAMFAAVFVVFIYKIAMRHLAGDAVAWADEVSVVLFVWILFWANAFVVRDRQQIRFDLVYRLLPANGRRVFAMIRLVSIGGLFLWALPSVVDYTLFLWRERTPVLGLRLDAVYSCFAIFVAAVVVRSGVNVVALFRSDWRRHI